MANHAALALLETALRARKLDRTLTMALPPLAPADASARVATDLVALDRVLGGGLPRGQLSEMAGPRSSGRTTLLMQVLAAATHRGETAALVDTFDRLDVASAVAAGVDLDRLLWIRGDAIAGSVGARSQEAGVRRQESGDSIRRPGRVSPVPSLRSPVALAVRTIDRALKALNLVLQAGDFGVVAIDLADAPLAALNGIPHTTWLRVQRTIEGSDTACVLVGAQPLARSAGGLTLLLTGCATWRPDGSGPGARAGALFTGMAITARIVSPRRQVDGEVTIQGGDRRRQETGDRR